MSFIYLYYNNMTGFFEDEERHVFGTFKKDWKRPLSNFTFQFVTKVVATSASSTGYVVEVTPESITSGSYDSEEEDGISVRYSYCTDFVCDSLVVTLSMQT